MWEIDREFISVWLVPCCNYVCEAQSECRNNWMGDEVQDPLLRRVLAEIITRASQTNQSHGDWYVNGQDVTVWVHASSLATGVVIENGGSIVKDASWLRPVNEDRHLDLAESDAVLKDINLVLQ